MSDDRKKFTGFDALSEIGRRIEDLSKAVQSKLTPGGEPQTFTIETARGPVTGVFGFEIRNLNEGAGAKPTPRRPAAAPQPAAGPVPEVFDEGDTIVVVLEVPVSGNSAVEAHVAGDRLTLRDTANSRDIAVVALPREVASPSVRVTVTNGIIEVRITAG